MWTKERKRKAQKKREETFMRKYGVKNPQQIKKVKMKTMKTCKEKYGGTGFASKELEKKSRDKMERRYGERNIMQTKEGLKRIRETFIEKYGVDNALKVKEFRKKLSESKKGQPSKLKGRTYEEIHGLERAKELIEQRRISGALGQSLTPKTSQPQLELFKLVKEVFPAAILEYPIYGYCIDIAIPELKLAIEYDSLYWHDSDRDEERDKVLKEFGWETIRFNEFVPESFDLIHD